MKKKSTFLELKKTLLSTIPPRTSTLVLQLIRTGASRYQPIRTVIVTSKTVMFQLMRRFQTFPLIPVKVVKKTAVYLARTKNTSVSYACWSSLIMQA